MNANELIDRMKNKPILGELDSKNVIRWGIRLAIDERDDIIAALSRSRIRNTATEPPTKEDAGQFDGMTGMVLARTWRGRAIVKDWEIVERDPTMYPQWTCVPEFEGGEA